MTPDDIRSMSDAELRRAIAEALGYTVSIQAIGWCIYKPDGTLHNEIRGSAALAWENIPNWPQSADDALGLLREMPGKLLSWSESAQVWRIHDLLLTWQGGTPCIGHHINAPRLISEVWYTWHLAQVADDSADAI